MDPSLVDLKFSQISSRLYYAKIIKPTYLSRFLFSVPIGPNFELFKQST